MNGKRREANIKRRREVWVHVCLMVHMVFKMGSEHTRLGRGSRAFQVE